MQKKKPRKIIKNYMPQKMYLDFLVVDVATYCHMQMKPFYNWLLTRIAEHITERTVIYNKSLVFSLVF